MTRDGALLLLTRPRGLSLLWGLACWAALGAGCQNPGPRATPRDPAAPMLGAFLHHQARSGRDHEPELLALAAPLLDAFSRAARLPGAEGVDGPRAAEEASRALDAAREGPARVFSVIYLDVTDPPAEGVLLAYAREGPWRGGAALEALLLDEVATDGSVDGHLDRVELTWSRQGSTTGPSLTIDVAREGSAWVATLRGGARDAPLRILAPEVGALVAHLDATLYQPHRGAAYVDRARRASPRPVPRSAAPKGTSFAASGFAAATAAGAP